jgi:hypothetical protein
MHRAGTALCDPATELGAVIPRRSRIEQQRGTNDWRRRRDSVRKGNSLLLINILEEDICDLPENPPKVFAFTLANDTGAGLFHKVGWATG